MKGLNRMSFSAYLHAYDEVVGVALLNSVDWIGHMKPLVSDGARFIHSASMTNELIRAGDASNTGEMLRTRKYLDESKEFASKLLGSFNTNLGIANGVLKIYEDILKDPTVPGTLKTLISFKVPFVIEQIAILTNGVAQANIVVSLHPSILKMITDNMDNDSNIKKI